MAKKSKLLSELRRLQTRKSQRSQNPLASLEKKLRRESFPFSELVVSPPGEAKMSEVLEDFVEPYSELAPSEKATRRLLTLAVLAWNASLRPESEQQEMIDQILTDDLIEGDQKLKAEMKEIINELITRKKRYFSDYKRMIIDFELKDIGSGYHLSVASTLEPTSPSSNET